VQYPQTLHTSLSWLSTSPHHHSRLTINTNIILTLFHPPPECLKMDYNVSFDNGFHVSYRSRVNNQEPATPAPAATPHPTPAPGNLSVGMSHQYVYQPVTAHGHRQQQVARNPWADTPSAPSPWSHPQPVAPVHVSYPFVYPAMFLVRLRVLLLSLRL